MIRIEDDWRIGVRDPVTGRLVTLEVAPPEQVHVADEAHAGVPAGLGACLRAVREGGASVRGRVDPTSLVLRRRPGGGACYERDRDYIANPDWALFGRIEAGSIGASHTVYASYRYGLPRLDTVVVAPKGRVTLRRGDQGLPRPRPTGLPTGEHALANIWVRGQAERLTPECLFPILEARCPAPSAEQVLAMQRRLPKTMARLRSGQPLRVLAWGDSVTSAGWLPVELRWPSRFADALRQDYPTAQISVDVAAWASKTSMDFVHAPRGSEHSYQTRIVDARPDLVVSLFVNDVEVLASAEAVEEQYARYLADLRRVGAEWIIVTPHYTQREWMGFTGEREIDEDPRSYVQGLRAFANVHGVALADASRHWGRLWRQGIPYSVHLSNDCNHPDADGMGLFVDASMAVMGASPPMANQAHDK